MLPVVPIKVQRCTLILLFAMLFALPAIAQAPGLAAVIQCGTLQGTGKVHLMLGDQYLGTVVVSCESA